jgi:hypothetical protein
MLKFFIFFFLIYFFLTYFGLSLSPSSRGTMYEFGSGCSLPDTDTIHRRLESLPNLYTLPLEDGLKENPKHVRQKKIRK